MSAALRISTRALHLDALASLLRDQAQLARTQGQLASGQRLGSAADAPADAAQALRMDQLLAANAAYLSNIGTARSRLSLEESALGGSVDVLQRARELALQANSGAQSADSRAAIASELRQLLAHLVALANADDGQGRFLFGGGKDDAPPFALAGAGASYAGDQQGSVVAVSAQRTLADGDAGSEVFLRLKGGNGTFAVAASAGNAGTVALTAAQTLDVSQWDGGAYTISFSGGAYEVRDAASALVAGGTYQAGGAIEFRGLRLTLDGAPADGDSFGVGPAAPQDVFATVQQLIAQVATLPPTAAGRARQQTALFGSLQSLDGALGHLADVRSTVGTRLGALDEAQGTLEGQQVAVEATLSGLRDLDYAEASTRLNLQLTALQAAQQSYVHIQGLSLFDFLR